MDTRPQLNTAMQAVDVFVDIDGRRIRAVIPREVFEGRLRSGAEPDAWLKAYERHTDVLHAVIRKRFAARPQDFVVVRSGDLAPLDAGQSS
jgi:hypothetical protein